MNCQTTMTAAQPHPNTALALDSTLIEKALEYQLTGAIMARLLARGQRYELLHSVCDRDGYDVVIEAAGISRHIQLKAVVQGGKRGQFSLHTRLGEKPSGCAIWINWDRATMQPTGFRFFGGEPGQRLPDLGDRVSRHSRGNGEGKKGLRPDHRNVSARRFEPVTDLDALVDRLFGPAPDPVRSLLLANMVMAPGTVLQPWLERVCAGDFNSLPHTLDWDGSCELAHLIDGYALVEALGHDDADLFLQAQHACAQASGCWPGHAPELWASLFLEHRRWRFAGPCEPDDGQRLLLDRLVSQLVEALVR
jgi:hypothetical protein